MEAIVHCLHICTPEDRQVFWQRASDEWLANIDPSFLDKSNEEKQLDDSEISSFITATKQLKKKTNLYNVWTRWCNSINERRLMEDIPLEELNSLLSHFFIEVRKLNGEEFEPGTRFQRRFPAPIPFRFAYFCHAFPVNR